MSGKRLRQHKQIMSHQWYWYFVSPSELSWSWSYGSWIYNYVCNQCLSLLKLCVRVPLRRGVLDVTLCYKVCKWLATGQWFSPYTPVSSTNKTNRHDITEILLKVALNTNLPSLVHQAHLSVFTFLRSTWYLHYKTNISNSSEINLSFIKIFHIHHLYILILKYQVHVYYSRRKYANVLPRLLKLTRKKLALKVASSTMMCSVRLGRDWHYLRLNEVIICQEHVVLCIHIRYHPQYDQTLELTTLVLIGTNNLCYQCLSVVSSNPVHGEVYSGFLDCKAFLKHLVQYYIIQPNTKEYHISHRQCGSL